MKEQLFLHYISHKAPSSPTSLEPEVSPKEDSPKPAEQDPYLVEAEVEAEESMAADAAADSLEEDVQLREASLAFKRAAGLDRSKSSKLC